MKRRATKTAPRRVSKSSSEDSSRGWMKKGKEISSEEERLSAESERKSEQRKRTGGIDPNRGRLRLTPGESADVIVLDETPESVAFYEHQLKKDGKWGNFESCPGEWENCPLCSSGDNKSFVWFLTILDLRGYTKDDGTEVPYYRRLLPIKQTQSSTYKRVFKAAMKEFGTIRGVMLTLERDTGDKSAAIGEPVILENGKMYDFLDEDELYDEYGHDAIVARNGDVLVKEDGLLEPFDYEAVFPKPNGKDIAKRWGLGSQPGSDAEYDDEAEEELEEEEDKPARRPSRTAKKSVAKGRRSRVPVDEELEDEEEEPEDDDDYVDPDGEEDEDEDEDEMPRRKAIRKLGKPAERVPARRAAKKSARKLGSRRSSKPPF